MVRRKPGFFDFDERFYIRMYPDVKIAKRRFSTTGFIHWLRSGNAEGRVWSFVKPLILGVRPSVGKGIFRPKALVQHAFRDSFRPDGLESRPHTLLVLIPDLKANLLFAGYTSFLKDISLIQSHFNEILFVVSNPDFEESVLPDSLRATVITKTRFEHNPIDPKLVIAFDAKTNLYAIENLGIGEKTIYYCQDLEAGFHPFGSLYIWSLRSLYKSQHLVVSTKELLNEFLQNSLLSTSSIHVTYPTVESFPIEKSPERQVFAYFRPESFNSRNLAEHIWNATIEFCKIRTGWTFLLVGTHGTNFEMTLGGNHIVVSSKLIKEDYRSQLAKSWLALSFIYSSHPGVLAFETSFSGIKTVTNTFGLRSKEYFSSVNDNLIGVDLIKEDLLEVLLRETEAPGDRRPSKPKQSEAGSLLSYVKRVAP